MTDQASPERSKRSGAPSASPKRRQRLLHAGIPYLFLLPFMLVFSVFLVLPIVYALGISVFETRLVGGNVFVGLDNYARAFGDADFWEGVRRMVVFGIFQVPIMLGLALLFALVLDSGTVWLRNLFRLGFYLPYAVPSVVAALLWG